MLRLIFVLLAACGGDDDDDSTGGYTPPVGALLDGDADTRATEATADVSADPEERGDIVDGLFMNRLDVYLEADATVGQVNDALAGVQAGIVSMRAGRPGVTIGFAPAADVDALLAIVDDLLAAPGVAFTAPARAADPKRLPPSPAGDPDHKAEIDHLLAARFPAAWNASRLALADCARHPVSILVADDLSMPGADFADFALEVPGYQLLNAPSPDAQFHGFDVITTMAAGFDGDAPTGADPFGECLHVLALDTSQKTELQTVYDVAAAFPAGKFILNFSQGYQDLCPDHICVEDTIHVNNPSALQRAYDANAWKVESAARWDDFLATVAAGNEKNKPGTAIYPAFGVAAYDSFMSIATLPDPTQEWMSDDAWEPHAADFTTLAANEAQREIFLDLAAQSGADAIPPAPNVLLVGSGTSELVALDVAESSFSDSGSDVMAIGEDVFMLDQDSLNGTSFAAPQLAGLASYLWLLSPTLAAQSASVTRLAIMENLSRHASIPLVDAYAAVLSLDEAVAPTKTTAPVRFAILDQDDDDDFDEDDLQAYLAAYVDLGSGAPIEPASTDYGRQDLNGDGYTGGARTAAFDLDRVGSTQFGETRYDADVTQEIEGTTVTFDEAAVTDLQVLCYYAWSPLYTAAEPDVRSTLLVPLCALRPRILYESGNAIWTIRDDGTDEVQVTTGTGIHFNSAWSPDGTLIAYTQFSDQMGGGRLRGALALPDIWVTDADGMNEVDVTNSPDVGEAEPAWSPDGTRIVCRQDGFDGENSTEFLVLVDVDTQAISPTGSQGRGPVWSPDGTAIAFYEDDSIWIMDADGANAHAITDGNLVDRDLSPQWSPDGTKFVFLSDRDAPDNASPAIWVMDADGSNPVRIGDELGQADSTAVWSPRGDLIAFTTFDGAALNVAVMRPDGSDRRVLTEGLVPSWSPDASRLAHDCGPRLCVVRADGTGEPQDLTNGGLPVYQR